MHALIFPTAIRIETKNSTYSFTSFRSRGNTLDHLHDLLQKSRQVKKNPNFFFYNKNNRYFSLQRQIDELGLNEPICDKSNGLNTTISDYNSEVIEKNQDEIKQEKQELNKQLDETTSISRTISESNLSNMLNSDPVYEHKKSSSHKNLPIKKNNSNHFTGQHLSKQQSNNLS